VYVCGFDLKDFPEFHEEKF